MHSSRADVRWSTGRLPSRIQLGNASFREEAEASLNIYTKFDDLLGRCGAAKRKSCRGAAVTPALTLAIVLNR